MSEYDPNLRCAKCDTDHAPNVDCHSGSELAPATGSDALHRADAIIKDMLVNHLPRIVEGLNAGYVDENQILVLYDHAVRARILKEHAGERPNS